MYDYECASVRVSRLPSLSVQVVLPPTTDNIITPLGAFVVYIYRPFAYTYAGYVYALRRVYIQVCITFCIYTRDVYAVYIYAIHAYIYFLQVPGGRGGGSSFSKTTSLITNFILSEAKSEAMTSKMAKN